ncbi:MAG TPA: Gfo/Idh/MocA family oxidoreductase [Dehalococcoidia bacterium]|nr:Gfo/Idh/MocA family oxidoreductase [Dehalococcoidia bacterium]
MTLRIGVVGVGFGATVHIPAFQSEGLDVVALCSRRRERVDATAAKFEIPETYIDFDTMLDESDIDAVSIATPVGLHHEMVMEALSAGKHVICEKPFALNAKQAQEMYAKAQQTGRTAMVAHEFRYSSARMRVKELLDEGYVGQPRMVLMKIVLGGMGRPGAAPSTGPQPYAAERDSAAQGAGFLFGLGSHYIDCLRHWFGEVESVSGELNNFSPDRIRGTETVEADADDTFLFNLRFRNGVLAQMIGTRSAPFGSGASVEIYGSNGALTTPQRGVNPPAHGILLGAQTGDEKQVELPIPERLQPFADDRDERLMPFRLMTQDFLKGIEAGTSPAPNFFDAWRCQQILDAVRESAASGHRVTIPE